MIAAAHRLFVANGYAATSLREVAEEARVGEQTVYRVFDNKPGLMKAVLLTAVSGDVEGTAGRDIEQFMADVANAGSPLDAVRVIGGWSGATYERGAAELEEVVFAAAQADSRLEDLAAFVRDARYEDVKALAVTVVAETGPPAGMTIDDIADYVYAVWSGPVYRQLVKERGWTLEKYIQWCVLMVQRMFLDQLPPQSG